MKKSEMKTTKIKDIISDLMKDFPSYIVKENVLIIRNKSFKLDDTVYSLYKNASQGIDWKAVSHAFRAGYQLKEIYETNDLKYPLKDAQFIKDVKYGKYHFKNDCIGEKLNDMLDEITELVKISNLPDKVDSKFLDSIVIDAYRCFF